MISRAAGSDHAGANTRRAGSDEQLYLSTRVQARRLRMHPPSTCTHQPSRSGWGKNDVVSRRWSCPRTPRRRPLGQTSLRIMGARLPHALKTAFWGKVDVAPQGRALEGCFRRAPPRACPMPRSRCTRQGFSRPGVMQARATRRLEDRGAARPRVAFESYSMSSVDQLSCRKRTSTSRQHPAHWSASFCSSATSSVVGGGSLREMNPGRSPRVPACATVGAPNPRRSPHVPACAR